MEVVCTHSERMTDSIISQWFGFYYDVILPDVKEANRIKKNIPKNACVHAVPLQKTMKMFILLTFIVLPPLTHTLTYSLTNRFYDLVPIEQKPKALITKERGKHSLLIRSPFDEHHVTLAPCTKA